MSSFIKVFTCQPWVWSFSCQQGVSLSFNIPWLPKVFTPCLLIILYYLHLYSVPVLAYVVNKFKVVVWGHIKIPGGECHRLKIWVMEKMNWSMHSSRKQQGCQQMCRQIMAIPLCMHGAFPTEKGKQMIVTLFNDVTTFAHASGREHIRKMCMSLKAVIWVFGTEHFMQFLGGHWPSAMAVSVPFLEKEYNQVEQCALFIHLLVPRLGLDTFS